MSGGGTHSLTPWFRAFTLAEILITLGIIGVVAALTMPSLIAHYKEKQMITALKKTYSQLSQAIQMSQVENPGDYSVDNIIKHLKSTKMCSGYDKSCTLMTYKYLNGGIQDNWGAKDHWNTNYAKLADGTIIRFTETRPNCDRVRGTSEALKHFCGEVSVDINGDKGPNIMGQDVFYFNITSLGLVPFGTKEETSYPFESSCKNKANASGLGCAAWVLQNENFDYLRCNDLSWDNKRSCK